MVVKVAGPVRVIDCDGRVELEAALQALKTGGVVAVPTDTLYGLAADVFSARALGRVFSIKGRPAGLALPVLVADWEQVAMVVGVVTELGRRLAQQFWPGPLTLVFPRSPRLPELLTGGKDTVAVRMPNHWVPLALAARLGAPITGTSANFSGSADPLTAEAVEAQLGDRIDYLVRCGPRPAGTPSTVVDVCGAAPRLLRQGAVSFQQVLGVCS